jgi:predicted tellurium resistance membrane protein TerC
LIAGGLFLLAKGTHEIHHTIEGDDEETGLAAATTSFFAVIVQIAIIDLIFSIDSIITAIGIAEHIEVMVAAIVISILVMYFAATAVGAFIDRHPTTKMLALSFLLLIGAALVADGIGFHIPRGYIYFSMAFAAGVEVVNVLARGRRKRRQISARR